MSDKDYKEYFDKYFDKVITKRIYIKLAENTKKPFISEEDIYYVSLIDEYRKVKEKLASLTASQKQFEEFQESLSQIDNSVKYITQDDFNQAISQKEGAITELTSRIVAAKSEIDNLRRDLNSLKQAADEKNAERYSKALNEKDARIEELEKLLQDEQENYKKLNAELEKQKTEYEHKIQDYDNKIQEYEDGIKNNDFVINSLNDDLGTKKQRINDLEQKITDSNAETSKLKQDIALLNETVADKDSQNLKLEETIEQLKQNKEILQNEIEDKENNLSDLQRELEDFSNEISTIKAEKRDIEEKLEGLEGKYATLLRTAKEKEDECEALNLNLSSKQEQLESWEKEYEEMLGSYQPLLESLLACPTFSEFIEKNDLNGSGKEVLFKLAISVGTSIDFALNLYKAACDVKKSTQEIMNAEEAYVYNAVNACYRRACNLDFDMFVLPGDQSITSPYKKVAFNRNEVENMLDPKKTSLKYSHDVYVPILKNLSGSIYSRAQVKASNI